MESESGPLAVVVYSPAYLPVSSILEKPPIPPRVRRVEKVLNTTPPSVSSRPEASLAVTVNAWV
jgi:hypothetical protein